VCCNSLLYNDSPFAMRLCRARPGHLCRPQYSTSSFRLRIAVKSVACCPILVNWGERTVDRISPTAGCPPTPENPGLHTPSACISAGLSSRSLIPLTFSASKVFNCVSLKRSTPGDREGAWCVRQSRPSLTRQGSVPCTRRYDPPFSHETTSRGVHSSTSNSAGGYSRDKESLSAPGRDPQLPGGCCGYSQKSPILG
jgi:hypothetical protein